MCYGCTEKIIKWKKGLNQRTFEEVKIDLLFTKLLWWRWFFRIFSTLSKWFSFFFLLCEPKKSITKSQRLYFISISRRDVSSLTCNVTIFVSKKTKRKPHEFLKIETQKAFHDNCCVHLRSDEKSITIF